MNKEFAILKRKFEQYNQGTLSGEDFSRWGKSIYIDILLGGYMEIDKFMLYQFVRRIEAIKTPGRVMDEDEYTTDEEIRALYDIVSGRKNALHLGKIMLSKMAYEKCNLLERLENYRRISEIVEQYNVDGKISEDRLRVLAEFTEDKRHEKVIYLSDLLEAKIVALIGSVFSECDRELFWNIGTALHVPSKIITHEEQLSRLLNALKCIIGERYIDTEIAYREGDSHIILMP